MAGHSQFKNIMHRKGAQDQKRAKIFTKVIKEIAVSVKSGGGDPNGNPRLRSALILARENNMPKDNIEKAIKKALGGDSDTNYEEMVYEGYGPAGTAIIVEALTDNKNRSAADIRAIFNKYNGNMAATGSVSFMFEYIGVIKYQKTEVTFDKLFDVASEAGAIDIIEEDDFFVVKTETKDLHKINEFLFKNLNKESKEAIFDYIPKSYIKVAGDNLETLMKMLDALENNDDVQNVFSNFDADEEEIAKFSK